jgi:hypothetical protein
MTDQVAHLTGRCMCGTVRFEVRAPLLGAVYCHCKRCQRRTGSAFSASALTHPGSFALSHGSEAIRTYRPGDGGWNKSYCSACGSHVFTQHPKHEQLLGVRLGTLDQDPGVRPRAHQFVNYAAGWAAIPDDGLPRFAERMPLE